MNMNDHLREYCANHVDPEWLKKILADKDKKYKKHEIEYIDSDQAKKHFGHEKSWKLWETIKENHGGEVSHHITDKDNEMCWWKFTLRSDTMIDPPFHMIAFAYLFPFLFEKIPVVRLYAQYRPPLWRRLFCEN